MGAAIARGSQKCNGTCALLASAATASSAAAVVVTGPGPARAISSGIENVPCTAYSSTAATSIATALTTVTSRAISAAVRATRRRRSNPMRKYEQTAVRSKNTNSSTRSWAVASPTIATANRAIHGQNRHRSPADRPSCSRCRVR